MNSSELKQEIKSIEAEVNDAQYALAWGTDENDLDYNYSVSIEQRVESAVANYAKEHNMTWEQAAKLTW